MSVSAAALSQGNEDSQRAAGDQVEEQKRRAEADKLAAITALEQRSREFMAEKEAKRRLEARISGMQSQLLIGGTKVEDTPVFRRAACLNSPCGTLYAAVVSKRYSRHWHITALFWSW